MMFTSQTVWVSVNAAYRTGAETKAVLHVGGGATVHQHQPALMNDRHEMKATTVFLGTTSGSLS